MSNAIKFAKEIYKKMTAIESTNSKHLKADYKKSIKRDYEDLKFYCECKNIEINDVWKKVIQGD